MTWQPIDLNVQEQRNFIALLKVAAAGRRIYMVEEYGEGFYRFDNTDSDWDDNIPDGSQWADEVMWLANAGLLLRLGGFLPDVVITDAGRAYLAEATG